MIIGLIVSPGKSYTRDIKDNGVIGARFARAIKDSLLHLLPAGGTKSVENVFWLVDDTNTMYNVI